MAVNIPGVVAIVVFYIIILVMGIWAGRKTARTSDSDEVFVANRSLGLVVMLFTTTATMVGGGFINGTAEAMAFDGLVWAQAPIGYCLALFFGGMLYAPTMRRRGYCTMFDPFQEKYGKRIGVLLFIPQLMGDIFWAAAILKALGSTIAIIVDLNEMVAIIVSACIAVFYTFLGGLYSVAYTDVIQLLFIAFGLFLAFPFALHHPAVDLSRVQDTWTGQLLPSQIPSYIDLLCLLIMGGIPWQVYYQRVLACKSPSTARTASIIAAVFSVVLAIPPMVIGVTGSAADWNQTSWPGEIPIPKSQRSFILPMVLNYLCPLPVGIIGLGAVSAAVMSSADSSVLATGTVFAKNIYKDVIRPRASSREVIWVLRGCVVLAGAVATVIAIVVNSVFGLFVLCSDLMYVILFPQLTCILWIKFSNTYGCLSGYLVGFVLRLCSGETLINLPPVIRYPNYHEVYGQSYPFRTIAMLCNFATIVLVSLTTDVLFRRGILPRKLDIFRVMDKMASSEQTENTETNQPMMEKKGVADKDAVKDRDTLL